MNRDIDVAGGHATDSYLQGVEAFPADSIEVSEESCVPAYGGEE